MVCMDVVVQVRLTDPQVMYVCKKLKLFGCTCFFWSAIGHVLLQLCL